MGYLRYLRYLRYLNNIFLYYRLKMSTYIYDFVFKASDLENGEGVLVPVDETNSVITNYTSSLLAEDQSRQYAILGDAAFYIEMNRVLANLHLIRRAHPVIGKLVSFVNDSNGNSFQVTLV
jgi:hypothetical protein